MWSSRVIAGLVVGSAAGTLLGLMVLAMFRRVGLVAGNYRGVQIVRASGVVLPIGFSIGLLTTVGLPHVPQQDPVLFAGIGLGFGGLGLLDDLFGDRSVGGFRGHVGALLEGRVTTGLIKACGGFALGVWAGMRLGEGIVGTLLAGLTIALWANFLNLLDVRPGRAGKVFIVAGAVCFALSVHAPSWLVWPALMLPVAVVFALDLREHAMLGDTGSNFLGSMIGLAFVLNFSWLVQLAAVVPLAAATILSEKRSFSDMIEGIPALNWLDLLGRTSVVNEEGEKRKG